MNRPLTAIYALLTGGVCLNLFLCLAGLVLASSIYHSLIIKHFSEWVSNIHTPEIRKIIFYTFSFVSDLLIKFSICFILIYWLSTRYNKNIILSCSFFVFGLLATDYMIYSRIQDPFWGPFFSNSVFSDNIYLCYFSNIIQWSAIFIVSVKISIFINMKKIITTKD